MPLTGFTPDASVAGARQSMTQLFSAGLTITDTQYIGFEDVVVVDAATERTVRVNNGGRLILGGNPRGAWSSTETYNRYDAVEHNGFIFVFDVNGNTGGTSTGTDPDGTGTGWFRYSLTSRPTVLRIIDDSANNNQREVRPGQASNNASALVCVNGGIIQAYNVSLELNGTFGTPGTNTAQSTIQIDNVTFRSNNGRNPIALRPAINSTTTFSLTDESFVGDIAIEGISGSGAAIYISEWVNGGATPESTEMQSGYFIGHGSNPQEGEVYTVPNYVGAANTFVEQGNKNDMQVSSANAITTVDDFRLYEFRNAVSGLWTTSNTEGVGYTFRPLTDPQQRSGAGIVTSNAFFNVQDDSGNSVEGATVMVLSNGEESITNGTVTLAINYDVSSDISDTDFPRLPDIASDPANDSIFGTQAENTWRLETDSSGVTETSLFHLGYWFFIDAAGGFGTIPGTQSQAQRISLGSLCFERTGNNPNIIASRYGYNIFTGSVDMTGSGTKEHEVELVANELVTDASDGYRDNLSNIVTFDDDTGNFVLVGNATVNNLYDAIHFDHIAKSTVGTDGQTTFTYGEVEGGDSIDGGGNPIHVSGAFTITAGDTDRYQGISNAQLTFQNADNIVLNGGTYISTSPSRFEIGAMINGCEVTANNDVRIAARIENSTINGRTILADGLTNTQVVNATFNGPIDEWPIPNATGHTYGGAFAVNLNPPGVWTNNTFNAGAQLNVQPNHVANVTAEVTEEQQDQADITIPDGARVLDLREWDNEGSLALGGTATWYALITPQQLADGAFTVSTDANVDVEIATLYPNNDINVVNDTEHPMSFIIKTGPAGTDISEMTVFHTGAVAAATDDNPTQTTTVPITRRQLNAGADVFRVFAASRLKIDYDSGEQSYQDAGGARNYAPINDPLAQTGNTTAALSTLTTHTVDTTAHRAWYVGLPTGSDYTSTLDNNADFFTLKSIDASYVNYIADAGVDKGMRGRLNGGVLFYHELGDGNPNTTDHTCGIQMTGTSTAEVPVGGAGYTRVNTDGSTNVFELDGNAAQFNQDVVVGLPVEVTIDGTTTNATIGVRGVPEGTIDYPRITNAVDNSQLAIVADDVANGVGWIVDGNASRIPVRRAYDQGNDYTDNL